MISREAADFFYESCCLAEDPGIDADDPVAVIDAAFLSSDCDDFAWVLSRITGWPAVTLMWNMGMCVTGHHSLVEAPDGRLLDVSGWTDRAAVAARAGVVERLVTASGMRHYPFSFVEDGEDEHLAMILEVMEGLERPPFTDVSFRETLRSYRSALPSPEEDMPLRGSAPGG